jgi:hypothetical protein
LKIRFTRNPKKNNKEKQKTELKLYSTNVFECPYCEQIITLKDDFKENYRITCPSCQHNGIIINKKEKEKKDEELPSPSWYHQPYLRSKIVGILLIAFGFIILINPTMDNLKISITLFFIGGLLLALISEKKLILFEKEKPKKTNSTKQNFINANRLFLHQNKLVISEKITLLIIIATLLLFLITSPADIEIFLVLLYLSLLIIKELIDEFTPVHVKKRLNIIIVVFFIIFAVIIAERIITILNI